MRAIAILSQKGGSGKTTLALHLAAAAERAGISTVVIDLDPQASAAAWGDSRQTDAPAVVSCVPARLDGVLQAARQGGAGLVLIDTAPHSESAALSAARSANMVLIPCRASILDLRAIGSTLDLVKLARKPASVVINCVPARGGLADEAAEALIGSGAAVCPVRIGNRSVFSTSLTTGQTAQEVEPAGKAAGEVSALFVWLRSQLLGT